MSRRIEVLLLRQVGADLWEALVRPGRRVPPGTILSFDVERFQAHVLAGPDPSKRLLRFKYTGDFWSWIQKLGQVPLPPYIKRPGSEFKDLDRERYQTVYAKKAGSVAAPTAGLHFTCSLLQRLHSCEITLHVGYGTFKPISEETVEHHQMESEAYSIDRAVARLINDSMDSGRRIIAVGTTTTRTLEHVNLTHGRIVDGSGESSLFILPGFRFGVVQGLLTNFHLPGSTLLALVYAFAGKELISRAYREAVSKRYRFYSYGDAMLIL
jgi:S-adenosylmethionine:tRNA ribosyltransferase-isomerase